MPLSSQRQVEIFERTVRKLQVLDEATLTQVIQQCAAEDTSPLQVLLQNGLAGASDVDLIDLMMRADEAIPGYEILDLIGRGGMGVVFAPVKRA